MNLVTKKRAFVLLGTFLSQFTENNNTKKETILNHDDPYYQDFQDIIALSQSHNGWFTPQQIYFAIASWAIALNEKNLDKWLSAYDFSNTKPKTIGLILAGNIPLVGFHDFLCVLFSGHRALIKTSSNDKYLLPFLTQYLIAIEPEFVNYITFTEEKLTNYDAIIATGSNNTARYFEYYFRNKPAIIRQNRNSVAVLDGNETKENLIALGEDIFRYFGLGCRNISKIFIPKGYHFKLFFEAMYAHKDIIYYEKYANNYDYNKAVYLMSSYKILDNEFMTLKEDTSYSSPISSLFYEYYDTIDQV